MTGSPQLRAEVAALIGAQRLRITRVLRHLPLCVSSCYPRHRPAPTGGRRGPAPTPVPEGTAATIKAMAEANPWYGYKRIAVMCRREKGPTVTDRQAYKVMKAEGLLHKPTPTKAELHQAEKLFDLLPSAPDQLWQADVTYIHLPGFGWWYAVTVIDYYSRYLLALHFTPSYSAAECCAALRKARDEAQRLGVPPDRPVILVTDNGSSFLARRFVSFLNGANFSHVRIRYRTPTQLGLLERFHGTLKREEVYWNWYDSPADARQKLEAFRLRYNNHRPHWALRPVDGGDPLTPRDVYVDGLVTQIPRWQKWALAARKKLEEMKANDASGQLAHAS
ncbi:MAG: IS3 family transposase [Myxococcales bacterium]|nr:IS3 family transposase [Myxococcales bacterium]